MYLCLTNPTIPRPQFLSGWETESVIFDELGMKLKNILFLTIGTLDNNVKCALSQNVKESEKKIKMNPGSVPLSRVSCGLIPILHPSLMETGSVVLFKSSRQSTTKWTQVKT